MSKDAVARILVVDDSPLVLNLTKGALETAGHEVTTADNPLTVPALVTKNAFDLVLVDLNMPAISGDTVVTILNKAGLMASKVLLFSEAGEAELKAKARACGALGFVKKGTERELVERVERFLPRP